MEGKSYIFLSNFSFLTKTGETSEQEKIMLRGYINGFDKGDLLILPGIGLMPTYYRNLYYKIKVVMLIPGSLLCL